MEVLGGRKGRGGGSGEGVEGRERQGGRGEREVRTRVGVNWEERQGESELGGEAGWE